MHAQVDRGAIVWQQYTTAEFILFLKYENEQTAYFLHWLQMIQMSKCKLLNWSERWQSPVALLGVAKLKVDPAGAAVVVVVPKPPNEPVKNT